ncbi:hypothetical protein CC1G_01490 [Coprinopsis cinerea okayama7|uniref:Uncharacterized protein n=1 Tax=Coprinopsis cinerea (strain Okayama-7 / 130 / ATCC MYA-4618 / FGSC 9003) TaxID=240176 RepID=A8NHS0_COPC7|nr:hypothetical protein CC1G_01490 [Coprinopsis cinerea okayama7\|eukprot:XP_001833813.2 hypothetical protein CC1G_01490 [Coprinopsis cinerea okayama7\
MLTCHQHNEKGNLYPYHGQLRPMTFVDTHELSERSPFSASHLVSERSARETAEQRTAAITGIRPEITEIAAIGVFELAQA